ncbi:galactoside ABC transporter permease [Stecheria sp. CLA-KB-P133]|uniref:Galactoside ABC transporter permease n=1 Tax=Grylomicrobium aquisgranensis TaxID=2926318 RepID=A0AB35U3J8_9FIRM|nr:galactoside ABC transporter permease [Stecheria sp. CLA-KB-P133]
MENTNKDILTAEQEEQLREPISAYVEDIQKQIDAMRAEGSTKIQTLRNELIHVKNDKTLDAREANDRSVAIHKEIEDAKVVENKHKDEIKALVGKAEAYLKANYKTKYLDRVNASCDAQLAQAKQKYTAALDTLKKEHDANLAKLSDKHEIKDENYVYKNRQFDAKMTYQNELQEIKDRRHEAFTYQYHLIDNLRMSRFTFGQKQAQKWENYRYTFNKKQFFLKNGLYIVIVAIFIFLAIITPVVKHTQLFTVTNVLNILQQASPRMFLALGVAGLILLTGTDLSVGRMVGMGMVTATIIMHQGINTGAVFGHIFDFTSWPLVGKALFALLVCIILTTAFATVAGFFMAKFRMHPFISTMSNMLIIFGIVTYATKGVSFGAIDAKIPQIFIPKINGFPTIILWAVAAIFVVWFIWNKTTLGKNLYAVGGNPEAATVSGISVFKTTLSAFILAGIMYGIGAWLECNRMVGSGSAAYGQGWDMDAIAACVVGGVSFTGGIGKISGVVVGVLIFTSLTYSLTILGIDTNLQFVFEGIIILAAVTLDCLKYVQKK